MSKKALDEIIEVPDYSLSSREIFFQSENLNTKYKDEQSAQKLALGGLALKELSYGITQETAVQIINNIIEIFQNRETIAKYLKPLEEELEAYIDHPGCPELLFTGSHGFVPGAWQEGEFDPSKYEGVLERALSKNEKGSGFHFKRFSHDEDPVPCFESFDDPNRNDQCDDRILNGRFTHRIAFYIILRASKCYDLLSSKARLRDGKLLELLTKGKVRCVGSENEEIRVPIWRYVMDQGGGSMDRYSRDATSPKVLNSILLCFGADLGLPSLQTCLLHQHWRSAIEMIARQQVQDGKIEDENFQHQALIDAYYYKMMDLKRGNFSTSLSPDESISRASLESAIRNSKIREVLQKYCDHKILGKNIASIQGLKEEGLLELFGQGVSYLNNTEREEVRQMWDNGYLQDHLDEHKEFCAKIIETALQRYCDLKILDTRVDNLTSLKKSELSKVFEEGLALFSGPKKEEILNSLGARINSDVDYAKYRVSIEREAWDCYNQENIERDPSAIIASASNSKLSKPGEIFQGS